MSFQAMTWATEQKVASPGQKLVLLMLANYCNGHTGQCNPSHKRLADECCMGVSTLKNHLSALAEAGLIVIIHKSEDGVSLPNQYRLKFGGVGQDLAEGGSESGRGVGQNLATNQEDKPGIEPKINNRGAKKAASIPEDFQPNETGMSYAEERKVNIATELQSFRNYHQAKGSTFKDWQAAWRTWCDNSVKFGRAGVGQSRIPKQDDFASKDYGRSRDL